MINIVQQFDSETLTHLSRMIDDDVSQCVQSRTSWMNSLVDVAKNYLGISDPNRSIPWTGASDTFIPMTMISIETAHPRILGGVIGLDQTVTATPTGGVSAGAAERVSNFVNWTLHSHSQIGAFPIMDKNLHSSELFGRSYTSIRWNKTVRNTTRRHTMPRYQRGAGVILKVLKKLKSQGVSPKSLEVPYGEHLQAILGPRLVSIDHMNNTAEGTWLYFQYYVNQSVRQGEAFVPTPESNTTMVDIYLTLEEMEKNAAELRNVGQADLYYPMDELDLKKASYVAERSWMDVEELYQLRQDGIAYFDDEVWYQIIGGEGYESEFSKYDASLNPGLRESRPEDGATITESEFRNLHARASGDKDSADGYQGVEVLEYHRRLRLGGQRRDYIFYYLPRYQWIFRICELGIESPSGRRPYDAWEFMSAVDDSARSLGIGHIIMDLQGILNEIFNKQMDRDDLLNMPFGFFKPMNFSKGQDLQLSPGKLIPTNDPSAVNFPNWARPTSADMPYIQSILGFVERLTSATNYFQGSSPSSPNAPRTYGATAAIIQEGNINFDLHIKRYQSVMYSMALDIQLLYQHMMPAEMEFLAPGASEMMKVSREDMAHEYGYVFKANASNTNPAVRQQMAQFVYSSLIMNPLVQNSVMSLYNITRRFAIAHDYIEFDQDVPRPSEEMMHAPMTQLEEIQGMHYGKNFSPLPTDNHEEHIKIIEEYLAGETGMEVSPEVMGMMITHLQGHQQMHAMMQRAQMTDAGGGVQPGLGQNPGMMQPMGAEQGGTPQ